MKQIGWLVVWLLSGLMTSLILAQDTPYLSLQTDSLALQTGQSYEIRIQLDAAADLWLVSTEIEYNPDLVYLFGTKSGSPVTRGAFFLPADSIVVLNQVNNGAVIYAVSQLAPAEPVSGSGIAGTFRIYPLQAGKTVLRFRQAQLIATTFTGEGTRRTADNRRVPFSAVQLELTITGDTVESPSEATATPEPTATLAVLVQPQSTAIPTLENLSALPTSVATFPAPSSEIPAVESEDRSGLIALAVGFIGLAVLGLGGLVVVGRRKAAQ